MSELNKEDPLNELVKNGMQMVGPYEELHKEQFILAVLPVRTIYIYILFLSSHHRIPNIIEYQTINSYSVIHVLAIFQIQKITFQIICGIDTITIHLSF